jgi:pimeloyl-ACP methyl ester carboxylesterase
MSKMGTVQVDCRGRRAQVEIVGSGLDVVFVGTAAPMMWSRAAAGALAGHGYTVTNFDYGSDCSDPEQRSALDQVADVVAVMDSLDIDRGAVVGLSRGAVTAFGVAATQPDRVSSLVLAMPVAGFSDTIGVHRADPEPEPGEDDVAFMRRFLARVFSEEYLSTNMEHATALTMSMPGEVSRLERDEEEPFPEDMDVGCPTLIIEGGADLVVSPEHPARYLKALPKAEHILVPGASHGWLMEQPGEFARLVAAFLSSSLDGSLRNG